MQGQRETAMVLSGEFKQAMRHLAGGVTIIATEHDGSRAGLAATAVCSVSADPHASGVYQPPELAVMSLQIRKVTLPI